MGFFDDIGLGDVLKTAGNVFGTVRSNNALEDLQKFAANAANPINVALPQGQASFANGTLTAGISPQLQGIQGGLFQGAQSRIDSFNEFNFEEREAETLDLLRQRAGGDESRQSNVLINKLFNTGRLGSTGGAQILGDQRRGLQEADLTRQLSAREEARFQDQFLLSQGRGALEGGLLASKPALDAAQIALEGGKNKGLSAALAVGLGRDINEQTDLFFEGIFNNEDIIEALNDVLDIGDIFGSGDSGSTGGGPPGGGEGTTDPGGAGDFGGGNDIPFDAAASFFDFDNAPDPGSTDDQGAPVTADPGFGGTTTPLPAAEPGAPLVGAGAGLLGGGDAQVGTSSAPQGQDINTVDTATQGFQAGSGGAAAAGAIAGEGSAIAGVSSTGIGAAVAVAAVVAAGIKGHFDNASARNDRSALFQSSGGIALSDQTKATHNELGPGHIFQDANTGRTFFVTDQDAAPLRSKNAHGSPDVGGTLATEISTNTGAILGEGWFSDGTGFGFTAPGFIPLKAGETGASIKARNAFEATEEGKLAARDATRKANTKTPADSK